MRYLQKTELDSDSNAKIAWILNSSVLDFGTLQLGRFCRSHPLVNSADSTDRAVCCESEVRMLQDVGNTAIAPT